MHPPVLPLHPRLHVSPEAFAQLPTLRDDPWFAPYLQATASLADVALDTTGSLASFKEEGHNWHLLRARRVQTLAWSAAVQARLTGDGRYVRAAMRYVQVMHDWTYWSWDMWRQQNTDPMANYDLSYGENAATLAVLHDWLHDRLTPAEINLLVATADRPIRSFLHFVDDATRPSEIKKPSWFGHDSSNWNSVCAGGAGMLALSLAEHLPQWSRVVELVEESLRPYMQNLIALDGAWPEGIGYWNYGMRYAFMYLLSHENAVRQPHPAIAEPATHKSLHFPADFAPFGVPCSFGDVNSWSPLPIHHLMARRVKDDTLAARLFGIHIQPTAHGDVKHWPHAAETLLMVRRPAASVANPPAAAPHVKLYQGLDWGVITAGQSPDRLAVTVRGGSTHWPHAHLDLTSFHAVVEDEYLIFNMGINEYLDTTFGPRRFELYDTTPASKNVVLINGLGITHPSLVQTQVIHPAPGLAGFQLSAAQAHGPSRSGPTATDYCRAFLMIDQQAILILDHLLLPHQARCESRLHTPMSPTCQNDSVQLLGRSQRSRIQLACNQPAMLHTAMAMPTSPKEPLHVLRWMTQHLHTHIAFATLLLPKDIPCQLAITTPDQDVEVDITLDGQQRHWRFTTDLTQVR